MVSSETYKHLTRRVWQLVLIIVLVVIGMMVIYSVMDYRQTMKISFEKVRGYRIALVEHATISFLATESVLSSAMAFLGTAEEMTRHSEKEIHEYTARLVQKYPQIGWINVKDEMAVNVANSLKYPTPKTPHPGLDYIKFHSNEDSAEAAFFSKPSIGLVTGKWRFFISKRISKNDGSFGGVAGCAFNPEYYQRFYDQLDLGETDRISLVRTDGVPLVTAPLSRFSMEKDYSASSLFQAHLSNSPSDEARLPSLVRGKECIVSYEKLNNYPVVAIVGIDYDEAMHPWKKRMWLRSFVASIIIVIFLIFSVRLFRSIKNFQRAENQLRQSEKKYRTLFENSIDGIFEADFKGRIKELNPEGCLILGVDRGGLAKVNLVRDLFFSSADRRLFVEKISSESIVRNQEMVVEDMQNQRRTIIISAVAVREKDGTLTGFQGVFKDITEQKKLQKQLFHAQKMEAIGTLAGGIAHDFNNILAAIMGSAELAKAKTEKGTAVYAHSRRILESGKRAKELIRQILSFSRQTDQDLQLVRVQTIANEVIKMIRATIPKSIDIKSDIDTKCRPVIADPVRIHQIIMNLCTNAYQAMRSQDKGCLSVHLRELEIFIEENSSSHQNLSPGMYLELQISDTGKGIPEAHMDKIFEPYFSTKKQEEGTGLGLAIVHSTIIDLGGDIKVTSSIDKGTSFSLLLPVDTESGDSVSNQTAEGIVGGKERILLLDDEPDIVAVTQMILEDLGYTVTGLSDSRAALAVFEKNPDAYDLVITDLNMPHLTGSALLNRILKIRPGLPVILCSGHTDTMDEITAREAGFQGYALKPMLKRELAGLIRKVLNTVPENL